MTLQNHITIDEIKLLGMNFGKKILLYGSNRQMKSGDKKTGSGSVFYFEFLMLPWPFNYLRKIPGTTKSQDIE